METRVLRYFLTGVREENIARTAEVLDQLDDLIDEIRKGKV